MPLKPPNSTDTPPSLKQEAEDEPPLSDAGLEKLRQKINETMLAAHVKVFESKLAIDKSRSPSRLDRSTTESSEEIEQRLILLKENLKRLVLWSKNCIGQIDKALGPPSQNVLAKATVTEPEKTVLPPGQKKRSRVPNLFGRLGKIFSKSIVTTPQAESGCTNKPDRSCNKAETKGRSDVK